ncbi:unnamed protein product [Urochloa humidicola]
MAGVELVVSAWKEWGLRALVLLSLTVQVKLLILAEFRRHVDSGVLKALAWSAYMLADAAAVYVLGHLSVTSRSPEHELLGLWAPFLLLHLGGQDKITAYAIEDNKLWLRHLQTLVVQVAAAAYVISGSSIIVGDSRSPLLLSTTVLMFMVGVVRYGERVWSLKCAGSSPTGNYRSDIGKRRLSLAVPESLISRLDPAEALLLNAHMLLDLAKDRFKGPLPRLFLCGPASPDSRLRGEEELYEVAEMQLSLLHDVFYTKAEATHTWQGLCIRVLSTLATVAAFSLFNILLLGTRHPKLNGYTSRVDAAVTYVLFVGAVLLETTSLVRAMLSSWTCALLVKYGSEGSALCNSLAHVPLCLRRLVGAAEWRRRRSWKRSMGQLNLVQLCVRSRASRWSKIGRWVSVEDWWNTVAYKNPSIPVSACTKRLLLKSMKARPWGTVEFESIGLYGDPAWVADSKLEERILIWHIATEVYLFWYKKDQEQGAEALDVAVDLVDVAQALSNYMLFLLASRPHMLPADANRNDYLVLCYALTNHMRYTTAEDLLSLLQRYAEALWANSSAPEFELTCKNTNRRGDKVLRGGCSLGAFLIHQRDSSPVGGTGTLEMICRVWAQMLCFVAEECSANSHAKQLSSGGELLTVAAVVAKYMRSRRLSALFHIESKRRSEW